MIAILDIIPESLKALLQILLFLALHQLEMILVLLLLLFLWLLIFHLELGYKEGWISLLDNFAFIEDYCLVAFLNIVDLVGVEDYAFLF